MEATMHAPPTADAPEQSAGQRWGLFAAAVTAALLGLTLIDVETAPAKPVADSERTAECIVASAVFVGVARAPSP